MQSKDIRARFISFFEERGHSFVASSPVVPLDDPTLLFANAGMNQFKPIFLGLQEPKVKRAVNSQKCIRAGGKHNDLEEVGKDGYHHTFFEMLGNWSFGDYYKQEAIIWAWELLTQVFGLPKDKLYSTVHHSDEEAFELWRSRTDIDPTHITYHGDKDNFWEMGETGPCGPCSEIHYDRGPEGCDKTGTPDHVCAVNGDCARYIELWNLVFIQYNRDSEGKLNPLKSVYVDTGGGLERFCQVLQGVRSNYDTDLFQPIIQKIAQLSGKPYSEETGISHRVIADHIRTLCFALADGGFPSNEGRGYVLRRILRRAARHGRLLGFIEPFLWKLVEVVNEVMADHFTELAGKDAYIRMVIKAEEERFNKTLDTGLQRFAEISANSPQGISGKDAFMLYDTYGFPLDLTQILAEEKGLTIDLAGFETEMQAQRDRARNASKFSLKTEELDWIEFSGEQSTTFVGYEKLSSPCHITRYALAEDGEIRFQLDVTPFYAESGGQLSDQGTISNADYEIALSKVRKLDERYIHSGRLTKGVITGSEATAQNDLSHRLDIARNHTATHLLHAALREVLGDQVQQKGSLVAADYLRFDFTHFQAVSKTELRKVESLVNAVIRENRAVFTDLKPVAEAKAEGAMALFGEKYGETVRVVSVDGFSKELCGGTHVSASGEIGLFTIKSESSTAAGIRRIEAVSGRQAYAQTIEQEDSISEYAHKLGVPVTQISARLDATLERVSELEAELKRLQSMQISAELDALIARSVQYEDFKLINHVLAPDADLKAWSDLLKDKAISLIAVLFIISDDNASLSVTVSSDLIPKFHAGNLVKLFTARLGGKGGGRPDAAQGGGKDLAALPALRAELPELIKTAK